MKRCPTAEMYSEGTDHTAYTAAGRLGCFVSIALSALVGAGLVWVIAGWVR